MTGHCWASVSKVTDCAGASRLYSSSRTLLLNNNYFLMSREMQTKEAGSGHCLGACVYPSLSAFLWELREPALMKINIKITR